MNRRSNHQMSPAKLEVLLDIDNLQSVPNLYSAGSQLHMSDLLVYKLKLKMKLQGVSV